MRCKTLRKRTPDEGGCRVVIEDGRILELHSPDGVHECWLRAADNTEANVWFNALHSALAALTLKALRLASALPDPQQLQHIGWLARRHCLQSTFFIKKSIQIHYTAILLERFVAI
ncbi:Syntrophin-1 [Acromyrmex echinatior]|uniref:Syntrophin-1 n=1 Tax=Acromyrmex echinatior TaxID=103372 RepID=F4X5D3_ACREC|nr:Syntrophin-1 [Acromyrmex echinatior]